MPTAGMSRRELLDLPATVDLATAARALGIGRTKAHDLAKAGEFPCRLLPLGPRYRVPTAGPDGLLALLGIDEESQQRSRQPSVSKLVADPT